MKVLLGVLSILVFIGTARGEIHTSDQKVQYYSSLLLTCDNKALNSSTNGPIKSRSWILADGELIDKTSEQSQYIELSNDAYYLNITQVVDKMFGYYHCIILYTNDHIEVIRHGVNINGADFADLHNQYRKNAIIGAIAAAVMVGIIGISCLVYHFRYNKGDNHEHADDIVKPDNIHVSVAYENSAMELEEKVPPQEEKANGAFDVKL